MGFALGSLALESSGWQAFQVDSNCLVTSDLLQLAAICTHEKPWRKCWHFDTFVLNLAVIEMIY
jgi:hypothetical protein